MYLLLKLSWLSGRSNLCAGPSNPVKSAFSSVCQTHTRTYTHTHIHKHAKWRRREDVCDAAHVKICRFRFKAVPLLLVCLSFFFVRCFTSAAIIHLHPLLLLPHTTRWHLREPESKLQAACLVSEWQSETASTSDESQEAHRNTHSFAFYWNCKNSTLDLLYRKTVPFGS